MLRGERVDAPALPDIKPSVAGEPTALKRMQIQADGTCRDVR